MDKKVLEELQEIKEMLQVIISNLEQKQKDENLVGIDTKDLLEKLRIESYRF